MKLKEYQKYLYLLFLKKLFTISFIFLCIVVIVNIFEEIRFSEKYNTDIIFTLYLSFLNAPSMVFEIFPFIFMLTINFLYLSLVDKEELPILNTNGISNFNIISQLVFVAAVIGVFLLIFFYSISSNLKSIYLDLKNSISNTNEYLAVVNDSGLWIKEEIEEHIYIINAEKFDKNNLNSITITEADKYYNNKSTIKAESAKIESKNWQLNDVSIINDNGKREDLKSYVHNSSFDGEIISNLFSNLNSLNIIELHNLSNNYLKIGYSNTDIKIHLNKIYSMPIFYMLMTMLGFIIINYVKKFNSKFFILILGVFISVIVYYLNYFSNVLGEKGILPVYLSVWVPLLILFLTCNIGILKINEN